MLVIAADQEWTNTPYEHTLPPNHPGRIRMLCALAQYFCTRVVIYSYPCTLIHLETAAALHSHLC